MFKFFMVKLIVLTKYDFLRYFEGNYKNQNLTLAPIWIANVSELRTFIFVPLSFILILSKPKYVILSVNSLVSFKAYAKPPIKE